MKPTVLFAHVLAVRANVAASGEVTSFTATIRPEIEHEHVEPSAYAGIPVYAPAHFPSAGPCCGQVLELALPAASHVRPGTWLSVTVAELDEHQVEQLAAQLAARRERVADAAREGQKLARAVPLIIDRATRLLRRDDEPD